MNGINATPQCYHHWCSQDVSVVMNDATCSPHSFPGQLGPEGPGVTEPAIRDMVSSLGFLHTLRVVNDANGDSESIFSVSNSLSQIQGTCIFLWLPRGRRIGEGWIGRLGLADTNYYNFIV